MLLRRVYQIIGWFFLAFAAYSLINGLVVRTLIVKSDNFVGSIVLGVFLAALSAVLGFMILKLATGPAEAGIEVLGIEDKALEEKEKSLVRKPQKAPAK